jgi:peroxiredoxin
MHNTRIRSALTAVAVSILTCAIPLAASPSPPVTPTPTAPPKATQATVGLAAPEFSLSDIDGNQHQLSQYAGRIVVLEWFNADCPYSGRRSPHAIHSTKRASSLRSQLRQLDPTVTYLIIDSTARNYEKAAVIKGDHAARSAWKIDTPILIDFDGKVGRAYKARTTPHMFVIDAAGVLRYHGAFDDDRKNKKGDKATNHVLEAVKKLKAGQSPTPSHTRPWGCGVKYN